MDHLHVLTQVESTPGSERHTFQLLAIRLFNVGGSTLATGLAGYYQAAFQLLRDALELVNLLDLFRIDSGAVGRWVAVADKKSGKEFEPFHVRTALEKHPDFVGQRRDHLYATYSNVALHPSYKGFQLIAPENSPKLGPFFDAKLLTALLEDLAAHLSHATLAVSMLIEGDLPMEVLSAKAEFLRTLGEYRSKYIGRHAASEDSPSK